ncbi:MAG: hypothetical protein R2873_23680 [Caldilineaceae bacterium]
MSQESNPGDDRQTFRCGWAAAALPSSWHAARIYFGITIILC